MKKFSRMLLCSCLFVGNTFNLQAMEYEDEAQLSEDASKYTSFKFSPIDKRWGARSITEKEDVEKVQRILRQQSLEKRVYLPDPDKPEEILAWSKMVNDKYLFYRPFIVENTEDTVLAIVELRTMPRAAYPHQEPLLNYYQGQGLMTYDPKNPEIEYLGKYRPVDDGKSSMLRMRLLPDQSIKEDDALMSDIIKGTSAFARALYAHQRPVAPYWSDLGQGIPKVIMSYTALEEPVRKAYKNAGFAVNPLPQAAQYWPEEQRKNLPEALVNTVVFINTINSQLMKFQEQVQEPERKEF